MEAAVCKELYCRKQLFEFSLKRACIRVVNVNIRIKARLDLLWENKQLTRDLVELCKLYYNDDRTDYDLNLGVRIRRSIEYRYLNIILCTLEYSLGRWTQSSYDRVFAIHTYYKIREVDFGSNGTEFVHKHRYICEDCYELYYKTHSKCRNMRITKHRQDGIFRIYYIFNIMQTFFFCNECCSELLTFPHDDDLQNGRVIQLAPFFSQEVLFQHHNRTIVHPTLEIIE